MEGEAIKTHRKSIKAVYDLLIYLKIYILDTKYSGKSSEDKFEEIAKNLKETNAKTYVITHLEEIACKFKYLKSYKIG